MILAQGVMDLPPIGQLGVFGIFGIFVILALREILPYIVKNAPHKRTNGDSVLQSVDYWRAEIRGAVDNSESTRRTLEKLEAGLKQGEETHKLLRDIRDYAKERAERERYRTGKEGC